VVDEHEIGALGGGALDQLGPLALTPGDDDPDLLALPGTCSPLGP
jgi:hypothetical protein